MLPLHLGASSTPPGGAPAELSTIHFKSMWTSPGGASTTGYSDTDVEREAEAVESVSVSVGEVIVMGVGRRTMGARVRSRTCLRSGGCLADA
ncbi:hypothetical protein L227DRAFT_576388 [Lentinus tigrinus ALCF2SS1-6]|uniref:Uncharacterized protein n=1 Tax=Lentinus tigrinus ALCF2SS1-6 TaxID=1328759 RepID=A0A5C2S7Q8_9APHY|nr:hypothetical protein L227DRAFT_576388 [Lentinus tigrinus ALCF2SS1-6]